MGGRRDCNSQLFDHILGSKGHWFSPSPPSTLHADTPSNVYLLVKFLESISCYCCYLLFVFFVVVFLNWNCIYIFFTQLCFLRYFDYFQLNLTYHNNSFGLCAIFWCVLVLCGEHFETMCMRLHLYRQVSPSTAMLVPWYVGTMDRKGFVGFDGNCCGIFTVSTICDPLWWKETTVYGPSHCNSTTCDQGQIFLNLEFWGLL